MLAWRLGLSEFVGFRTRPGTNFGTALFGALQLNALRIEAAASQMRGEARSSSKPGAGATFALYRFAAKGCWLTTNGRWQFGPCVGAELGVLRGHGYGVDLKMDQTGLWFAATLGASLDVRVASSSVVGLTVDAEVPQIYEQHFDFAWRSLRRLGVAATDLEDAAQDVFEIVHRRIGDFEHRSTVRTWIFGIALRVAKVYRHKAARQRQRVPIEEALLVSSHRDPEQAKAHVQAAELVQRLLDEPDDDKRAVFILAELERVPAAEIATALGIPTNTVYSRLRLARAAFEAGLHRLQAKDEWRYR